MRIYTRHNNDELFDMMQGFIPLPVIKCDTFNHWEEAADYIAHVIEQRDDVAVNVDLDCFIFDWAVVEELAAYMVEHGYTHCGFPDSGAMRGRHNTSWVVCNPFFNVFRSKHLIANRKPDWGLVRYMGYNVEWHKDMPPFVKNPLPWMQEPFNGIFNWMHAIGKTLFIQPKPHPDGTSTILTFNGKEFGYHAWYSRLFDTDEGHRARILALYHEAKEMKA